LSRSIYNELGQYEPYGKKDGFLDPNPGDLDDGAWMNMGCQLGLFLFEFFIGLFLFLGLMSSSYVCINIYI
jgi:hypothetical protein